MATKRLEDRLTIKLGVITAGSVTLAMGLMTLLEKVVF